METLLSALTWDEGDLERLLGQPESFRLEFKSGSLFRQSWDKGIETLSKEVSAFANSEGGVIVLGISERKGKKLSVADTLDGLETADHPTPRIQQAVESSVSPALAGLRFHTIRLSRFAGRVCVVIVVPPGTTAHQANDRRYYGRSEFEAKPLADHDVRLRMQRGRVRRARVVMRRWLSRTHFRTSDGMFGAVNWQENPEIRFQNICELEELQKCQDEIADIGFPGPVVTFTLAVVNEGELTIRDLSVELGFKRDTDASLFAGVDYADVELGMPIRWDLPRRLRLHPDQALEVPLPLFSVVKQTLPNSNTLMVGDAVLKWTLYLEDGTPAQGEIDLAFETDHSAPVFS